MANVAMQAKLVGEPVPGESPKGPLYNMRVREVNPGHPSMFIDVVVYREDLVEVCSELSSGDTIEILIAELSYREPKKRSGSVRGPKGYPKHQLVVRHFEVVEAD